MNILKLKSGEEVEFNRIDFLQHSMRVFYEIDGKQFSCSSTDGLMFIKIDDDKYRYISTLEMEKLTKTIVRLSKQI